MSDFFEELSDGEIHLRDKYQLELKSEYSPVQKKGEPSYKSEFYIFIPSQLQINRDSYSKKQFYRDQMSMIRYKTPVISLEELMSKEDVRSPFFVLSEKMKKEGKVAKEEFIFELKLLANIIRSQLRDRVRSIIHSLSRSNSQERFEEIKEEALALGSQLETLREELKTFYSSFFLEEEHKGLKTEWDYVDEFLSVTIEHYLANLLDSLRSYSPELFYEADQLLCAIIKNEESFRERKRFGTIFVPGDHAKTSRAIYRMSLLNKYIFDVLFLKIIRKVPKKGITELAAAFAAGLAMFIYLVLLTWQGTGFVIDSTAFIVFSVLLYILKDRMKEGVRNFSTRLASEWFSDYTTEIKTPDKGETIGRLKEYFSFLDEEKVPPDILKVREREFQDELDRIKRLETVIYFRKDVEIWEEAIKANKRLRKVNDIFRYNLSQYFLKASDAHDYYPYFNPDTNQIQPIECARVYHVNIVLKKTYTIKGNRKRIEFDKFRVVVDKEGILRVEKV